MVIQSLHIYPVKSCRGIHLLKMNISELGPATDREWMLIDNDGKFLTQRTLGKMAQVEIAIDETHLTLAFAGRFFKINRQISKTRPCKAQVWDRISEVHEEPLLYSEALSEFLGVKCFLVRWQQNATAQLRFSDRAPVQILNLKSLEDLNSRMPTANSVSADRFRANIVFQGKTAFAEESWQKIRIGKVIFSCPQKCSRCKIITLDAKTGENRGPEPLKTLSTYRREGSKVNFGMLWFPENAGTISEQDQLEILE